MSFKNAKVDYPGSPSTSGYGIVNADLSIQNLANELDAERLQSLFDSCIAGRERREDNESLPGMTTTRI